VGVEKDLPECKIAARKLWWEFLRNAILWAERVDLNQIGNFEHQGR
jgi:hypothetical protein